MHLLGLSKDKEITKDEFESKKSDAIPSNIISNKFGETKSSSLNLSANLQQQTKKNDSDKNDWNDDDLFDILGLGDTSRSLKIKSNIAPKESNQMDLSKNPKIISETVKNHEKALPSAQGNHVIQENHNQDEFIPSFLLDNAGGRRRRGPLPSSTIDSVDVTGSSTSKYSDNPSTINSTSNLSLNQCNFLIDPL